MPTTVTAFLDGSDNLGYGITTDLVNAAATLNKPIIFPNWGPKHQWSTTNVADQVACPVADIFLQKFVDEVLTPSHEIVVCDNINHQAILDPNAYQGTQVGGSAAWGRAVGLYDTLFDGIKKGGSATDVPIFSTPGRVVRHAPFTSSSGYRQQWDVPARDEAWLVYDITWGPTIDWETPTAPGSVIRQSGKFPGLATQGNPDLSEGSNGTGNTGPVYPEAWSARCAFGANGLAQTYIYDQARSPGSGGRKLNFKNADGTDFRFSKGVRYRITQRVKVNTPTVANGHLQIWVDEVVKFNATNIKWIGDTSTNPLLGAAAKYDAAKAAKIDSLKVHNYYGGGDADAPQYESFVTLGTFRIYSTKPSFLP